MPVARYSACKNAWHGWEQPVLPVCGVVPVADIVLALFPAVAMERSVLLHSYVPAWGVQNRKITIENFNISME